MSPELMASVVLPTYNRKESLRRTLDGLARQTYPCDQWEAVIVSDGSTDGTDAFLTEYAATAPFTLRPIFQANAGPSRARNRGIQEARGEVVVFLDDDVEPAPDFLATHLRHYEDKGHIAVIGPLLPDPERRNVESVWIGWEHAMLEKQYHAFYTGEWATAGPNHFYSGNASVRRADLLHVGSFDESFTRQEDVEMAYRLERECGVTFAFDASARALHRPLRTWESWLDIPFAYGRLDVVRARRGIVGWGLIENSFVSRSRPTRMIAWLVLALPALRASIRALLRMAAAAAYRIRRDRVAFGALSVMYNVHYLEGARAEMGNKREFVNVLRGHYP